MLKDEKIGLVKFYRPLKSREQIIKLEMSSMVSRIFNGSAPAMANFLLKNQNLKEDDIKAMKEILRIKEDQLRGKS